MSLGLTYNLWWFFEAIKIKRQIQHEPDSTGLQRAFKRGEIASRTSLGLISILYLLNVLQKHGYI